MRTGEIESSTLDSTTSILHLSIASSEAKGKLGKNTKVLQGTKGMQTQAKVLVTMDYSFLALNSSYPSMYPKGSVAAATISQNSRKI